MIFHDRLEAGERLAAALHKYRDLSDGVVLGIPRGGIVIAKTIASELNLPLGICPVRKLGAPGNPELALGAVDDDRVLVLDPKLTHHLGIADDDLLDAANRQRDELRQWLSRMGGMAVPRIEDRTVIRSRLAPGWSWDEFVKPQTDGWTSCPEIHHEYVVSGRIRYLMEDGSETVAGPGSYLDIQPGHRAWVEGDEECILIDWD